MCLIGDKAKVNVIAPHFGEGQFASLDLSSPISVVFLLCLCVFRYLLIGFLAWLVGPRTLPMADKHDRPTMLLTLVPCSHLARKLQARSLGEPEPTG
jgi:hypothetical protein